MIGGVTAAIEAKDNGNKVGHFVGDLLLTFGPEGGVLRGRNQSSPDSILAQTNEWSLYSFPTSSNWKGYPVSEFSFGNWQVWVLGEIYGVSDEDETRQIVKDCIEGIRDFSKLNGHYSVFAWNSENSRWNIWTNRLGTLHIYQTKNAIGTSFNTIVRAVGNLDLDSDAILGFFTFGFFPQNRTYSKDVRIIRPATHEVFDATGKKISEKRYWSWVFNPDTNRNYEKTVDEFGSLLNEVMAELSNGKISLPISGGLDSRSTVAALFSNDKVSDVRAYSYGYTPDSEEIKIARQIASARNIPFESFLIPKYLFESLPQIIDAVEGFQDVTQSRQASVANQLQDHGDYVIAAHWGDVWLDDPDSGEMRNDDEILAGAMKKFKKRGSSWLLENVNSNLSQNSQIQKVLSEMMRSELNALNGIDDPEFRLKALKTEQWSFRWTTSSLRAYQIGAFPRLPFYDTRMIDFFSTVPSDFVRERGMQVDYLKRFAPDLARIPWQVFDANLYHYKHYQTWLLPKRVLKKMRRVIKRQKHIERNWEAQFLNKKGHDSLKQFLCRNGSKIEEFFPSAKIETLVDELYVSPTPENGYAVSMLLTFAAWIGENA
jgi:asparagine synthetase B (glutamine-hydrolysing)